ncbi:MAG: preprotein translocase subunit SecE [Mollicutes bacterium]|nr:preprotein translocase subunit SecE [Mollicutes bacterium]
MEKLEVKKMIKDYFLNVKKEVKKIRWPNKKDMAKYSSAVLSFCFFFALYFFLINIIIVFLKEVLN